MTLSSVHSQKKRHRCYSSETRNYKRAVRRQQPLERMIRNATGRTRTAWHRGHYGTLKLQTSTKRAGTAPGWMNRCRYHSVTLCKVINGYEIREVITKWCSLVALWSSEGVVCIPIEFVQEGHSADEYDPGRPPLCCDCGQMTFSERVCMFCGTPLFFCEPMWMCVSVECVYFFLSISKKTFCCYLFLCRYTWKMYIHFL